MNLQEQNSSNDHILRYTVQSSDVLSDMRVNVRSAGTDTVIWYKERYLAEDEIIEHVVENANSTVHWTIHKPIKGWYIRLRAPSFPPGSFISLTPVPSSSPYSSEAALTFSCRTNVPSLKRSSLSSSSRMSSDSDATLAGDSTVHSYPPTPPQNPSLRISPPSPQSVHAKLAEIPPRQPAQQITAFILTPHSHMHLPDQKQLSVFARMMSALKNSTPSRSSSFTLSTAASISSASGGSEASGAPASKPLLTYHDRTPVWQVGSTHGVIELDTEQEKDLGVHPSFYFAVALTYMEFLAERESYLAAATD